MTGASLTQKVAPHEKRHKEYLAILAIYTSNSMGRTTELLNKKFEDRLDHDDEIFEWRRTLALWQRMSDSDDRIVQWARGIGKDNWRVKRVLKWVEEQEEEGDRRLSTIMY